MKLQSVILLAGISLAVFAVAAGVAISYLSTIANSLVEINENSYRTMNDVKRIEDHTAQTKLVLQCENATAIPDILRRIDKNTAPVVVTKLAKRWRRKR